MEIHDPTEPSERVLRTMVDLGEIEAGERVGRFTVLEQLGEGGMGTVWSAFDPALDRKVALKFLRAEPGNDSEHPGGGSGGKDPLLREAQALAKLSHPNVVAVHEVDTHRARVFMAFELVQGTTLKKWLAARRRPWREVLHALLEAGRGLAAAHAAGVVHRDVKPANILVGDDGRVRISDFGLALARRKPEAGEQTATTLEDPDGFAVAGTPAYMAPEQLRGLPVDARSDQFSFCVVAWEALCGVKPFARTLQVGESSATGSSTVTMPGSGSGARATPGLPTPLPPPAPGYRPPQRLVRLLARGLSADPAQRHPSMNGLLDALERKARPVRPAFVVAAAAVLLAAVPVLAMRAGREACAAGPEMVGRAWGPEQKERLKKAFASAGAPAEALERAAGLLDKRADTWTAAYRDACEATRVQRGQSEAVLDLRLGCLETRRQELGALVRILEGADAALAARAADAVHALPRLEGCANVVALSTPLPPPEEARQAIAQLSERQTAVTAEIAAGRYTSAMGLLEPLIVEADRVQYAPLQAQLWRTRGRLLAPLGRTDEAIQSFGRAAAHAERGRDDLERARASASLGHAVAYYRQRFDEGYRWLEMAVATYQHSPSPEDEGEALSLWVTLLNLQGKYAEALGVLERLDKIALSLPPDHALVYRARLKRAELLVALERTEEGIEVGREAVALAIRQRGPNHPIVAGARLELLTALLERGLYAEAHDDLDQAETIFRTSMPDSLSMLMVQIIRVRMVDIEGDPKAAVELARRLLEPLRKKAGPDHQNVVMLLEILGNALVRAGHPDEAVIELEKAVAIETKLGVGIQGASVRLALARALWAARKDTGRALELARAVAKDTAEYGGAVHREALQLIAAHQ